MPARQVGGSRNVATARLSQLIWKRQSRRAAPSVLRLRQWPCAAVSLHGVGKTAMKRRVFLILSVLVSDLAAAGNYSDQVLQQQLYQQQQLQQQQQRELQRLQLQIQQQKFDQDMEMMRQQQAQQLQLYQQQLQLQWQLAPFPPPARRSP
ncbi:MAG: hypothetical protein CVU18_05470 [Betaproteobacteria bacterium HGW-Betaproteobacteria-12]|nr:MAG: hypothetical protein CVU18_05470 [Betaproteobacteria bacterium HGW-Betaproteobacteria-12]